MLHFHVNTFVSLSKILTAFKFDNADDVFICFFSIVEGNHGDVDDLFEPTSCFLVNIEG
jgi:hypothetical protein